MSLFSNLFGQKKYPEEWNFYITNVDDKIGSIYINLALHKILPLKDKSNLSWIAVKLNNPTENGLTTNEEGEKLFKIEDKILEKISNSNSIYVGRLTTDGFRDFYFYSKDTNTFKSQAQEIIKQYPEYEFIIDSKSDKKWEGYLDIYPTEMDFQSISNRDVLENLEKNGDNLTKEREVFHWIYFKNEVDRNKYIEFVKKENFEVVDTNYHKKEKLPYSVQIKRVDKVGYSDIDEYTLYLWKLAKNNNGDYDGWETSVETE